MTSEHLSSPGSSFKAQEGVPSLDWLVPVPVSGINSAPFASVQINQQWATLVIGALSKELEPDSIWAGDEDANFAANQVIQELIRQLSQFGAIADMEYVQCELQLAVNTDGGTMTNNTWHTRQLNTVVFDTTNAVSIDNGAVNFQAGKWLLMGRAVGNQVNEHRARLLLNDTTVIAVGTNQRAGTTDTVSSDATVFGYVESSDSFTIKLQHRCTQTRIDLGFGVKANMLVPETYAVLCAIKIGD